MDDQMAIEITEQDEATIIAPNGDIDLASSPALREQLRALVESARKQIVVNLQNVPYMDSSGVATLVELLQSCRRKEVDLVLCSLNERVLSVFQIARLDGVFRITPTLEEAVGK